MNTFMRATVHSVGQLFSGNFRFHLPWFQRLYAWSEEQLARLLNDIEGANQPRGGQRGYFLGNLMVSQKEGSRDASVADGHQRLVTLTILFSVLRDLATADERAALHRLVWRQDEAGADAEPHLVAQSTIAEFLLQHVQTLGATQIPFDDARLDDINAGERNIILNRDWLVERLATMSAPARHRLAEFILQRCFVTVSAVEDEEDARIIFAVSQTTGLRLGPVDLFKADVLSALKPQSRRECARIWERCQAEVGPESFQELLGHLRSLMTRRLKRDLMELELWRSFRLDRHAEAFVRRELPMRVGQLKRIDAASLAQTPRYQPANRRLQYLGWVTHRGWVPPLLHWLSTHDEEPAGLVDFLVRLERLAYYHMIVGTDGDERDRRYLRIISDIDNGRSFQAGSSLALSATEVRQMREALGGPKLVKRRLKVNLMLRINGALEGDETPRSTPAGTLEHVLPQGPARNGAWALAIPDPAEHARLKHSLGNLSVLTESENAAADNRDYASKRPILAASPFVISRRLAQAPEWTAEAIDARTLELIDVLMRSMGLAAAPREARAAHS